MGTWTQRIAALAAVIALGVTPAARAACAALCAPHPVALVHAGCAREAAPAATPEVVARYAPGHSTCAGDHAAIAPARTARASGTDVDVARPGTTRAARASSLAATPIRAGLRFERPPGPASAPLPLRI